MGVLSDRLTLEVGAVKLYLLNVNIAARIRYWLEGGPGNLYRKYF